MKGALERVLNQCDTYLSSRTANDRESTLNAFPLTNAQVEKYIEQATTMGSSGLRGMIQATCTLIYRKINMLDDRE